VVSIKDLFSRLAYLIILAALAIFLTYVAINVWNKPLLQHRDFFIAIVFFSMGIVVSIFIWKIILQPIFVSFQQGAEVTCSQPATFNKGLQPLVSSLEKRLKKTNIELLDTEFELMEKDKLSSMGEISAKLAHEIKNPLAIINNAAFFLKNTFKKPSSEVSKQVEILFQETDRINKLVADLLQFSRISVSKDKDAVMIDVNEVLDDAVTSFEFVGARRAVPLQKKYAIRLPRIKANPDQLKQIFLNIISNACQSMENSGLLTITTDVKENIIKIVFTDTGCGIASENLKEIFTPFFSTKEPGKGTGLGLYICKSLIKGLNGDISVQSEAGKGTSFTIGLPVRKTA
jgi:signal transduction histidine kinase